MDEHIQSLFLTRTKEILDRLLPLTAEEKYTEIITWGRGLPTLPQEERVEANLVRGCQSALYLVARAREGVIEFVAHSDALISQGLAALLIRAYSGLSPETVFQEPPTFLKDLGLGSLLSPTRSLGLASMFKAMQRLAALQLNNATVSRC